MFSKGLKNEFETAMVNESPVFEPLKFYCIVNGKQITKVSKDQLSVLLRRRGERNNLGIIFFVTCTFSKHML